MKAMQEQISIKFKELFQTEGGFFASPGRINLIGEHTDYNGGFVFPGAVDKGMIAEIKPNGTGTVRAYALDLSDYAEFGLTEEAAPKASWARYIFGVCREIIKRGGNIQGFDTVFAGDVPLGAGMSSSAALESTFAFALNELFALGIDKFELAKIGQSTEHNYCGVKCGIMDQFASVFGKAGSLIRLDCRSLEYKYYPFNPVGYKLVLVDSVVKHELASSAYNKRRQSCENVVAAIRRNHPQVEFLRDASMEMLNEVKADISAEDYMRAEYVIEEIQRVLDVCDALERDDYETVGATNTKNNTISSTIRRSTPPLVVVSFSPISAVSAYGRRATIPIMTKKKTPQTIEECNAELELTQKKIRQYENRSKMLDRRLAIEKRKARNHRLCSRGGFIESIVPELITMTDEDAQTFFRLALTSEPAREFLRKRAEETTS